MEHWFPLLIVLSHVTVFHFYAVPAATRLMYQRALNRNPRWISAHPEFTADYPEPRLSLWFSYAMGLVIYPWIFSAPYFARFFYSSDAELESALIDSLMVSVGFALLHHAVYFLRVRSMIRQIPPAEIREASLERRALGDYVRVAWIYAAALLITALCGVYTYALLTEVVSEDLFVDRLSSVFISCLIWVGITLYVLRRKPTDADELFSGRFRLWEMRASVGMLYFGVFFWGACVLGDVFDVFPFTDLSIFVAMSVTLQVAAIWASRNKVSPLD
jgi:hypothetical protein